MEARSDKPRVLPGGVGLSGSASALAARPHNLKIVVYVYTTKA